MSPERRAYFLASMDAAATILSLVDRPDPSATFFYELLSGGVIWSDEREAGIRSEAALTAIKYLAHHRTRVILGEPSQFTEAWQRGLALFPAWIGFRPERCAPSSEVVEQIRTMGKASDRETRKIDRLANWYEIREARKRAGS